MKKLVLLTAMLYTSVCFSQGNKSDKGKGPTEETIFKLRKEADAALVLTIQSIVPDTCRVAANGNVFVITGKVLKKYFDKTAKFKEQKIIYHTTDTSAYSGAAHTIVFLNYTAPVAGEKCKEILWTSKPGNAIPFSTKTEVLVGKKQD